MRMTIRASTKLLVASLVLALASCGTSEPERQAEEAAKAAEAAAKATESAAQSLKAMGESLEALTGEAPQGDVEPVSFRELQTVFGELDGWQKGKPTGERMTSPVAFSQAEVTYTRGEANIEAKLIDTSLHQLLLAPYAVFLAAGYERETDQGYEKSTKVAGHSGWETWNGEGKHGELNVLVSRRFLLTLEGDGIGDTKVLRQLAEKCDLKKLAALK